MDVEGHSLQHPLPRYIAEPHIPELDLALDLLQLDGIRCIHQLRLDIHDGKDLFTGSQRRLQPVELFRQVLDGGKELGNVHIKGNDGAACQGLSQKAGPLQIAHTAQVEQAQDRADVQHIHQRTEHTKHEDLLLFCLCQCLAAAAEIRLLLILPAKDLDDLDAGEVLGQVGVDIGGGILYLAVRPAGKLAEDHRKQHDKGHKAQHHQGQLIIQADHRHQDAQDHKRIFGQVDQQIGEHHGDSVGVVGHTGDQLAHRDLVELLMGQRLDMDKQILTQVRNNALSHFLQDHRLEIGAAHREQQHSGIYNHCRKQVLQRKGAHHQFLDITDQERRNDIVGDREQHQKAYNHKLRQIGPCIRRQAADDLPIRHIALKTHGGFFILDRCISADQQCRHGTDDAAHQQKRVKISHCSPPLSHPPAAADLPCAGTRHSGHTAAHGCPHLQCGQPPKIRSCPDLSQ